MSLYAVVSVVEKTGEQVGKILTSSQGHANSLTAPIFPQKHRNGSKYRSISYKNLFWHQFDVSQQHIGRSLSFSRENFVRSNFSDVISPISGPKNSKCYKTPRVSGFEAKHKNALFFMKQNSQFQIDSPQKTKQSIFLNYRYILTP